MYIGLFFASAILEARQEVVIPESARTVDETSIGQNLSIAPLLTTQKKSTIEINDSDLLVDVELFSKVLDAMIERQEWSVLGHLVQLYATVQDRDEQLLLYARSRLAHSKRDYPRAIAGYRQMLETDPNLAPVRLYLVQALYDNREYEAASFQLEKLKATPNLPPQIISVLDRYTLAIQKKSDFEWNLSLYYINDNNINETSSDRYVQFGNFLFERDPESLPKSDQGIGYGLWGQKSFILKDKHSLIASLNLNGKAYREYSDYNDLLIRLAFGYQWQDANKRFALLPFLQKRFFGDSPYSQTWGLSLQNAYQWSYKLQSSATLEVAKNSYDERKFLDGWYMFASLGLSYAPQATTMFFGGFDIYTSHAQEKSESFDRLGVRLGVANDFKFGSISSKLSTYYAKKEYEDAPNLFGKQRSDRETIYTLSLWKRDWHFRGVMPKLNIEYSDIQSNINIFEFDKSRVFFSFDKRF